MQLHAELHDPDGELTPRLGRLLTLLCEGLSRKKMAGLLNRSESTINNQLEELYARLGTHNVGSTIALSVARGLVRISTLCLVYSLCLQAIDFDLGARRPPQRTVKVRTLRGHEGLI